MIQLFILIYCQTDAEGIFFRVCDAPGEEWCDAEGKMAAQTKCVLGDKNKELISSVMTQTWASEAVKFFYYLKSQNLKLKINLFSVTS